MPLLTMDALFMKLYNATPTTTPQQRQGAHLIGTTKGGSRIFRLLGKPNLIPTIAEERRLRSLNSLTLGDKYYTSAPHFSFGIFVQTLYKNTHAYAMTNSKNELLAWVSGNTKSIPSKTNKIWRLITGTKEEQVFEVSMLGSFSLGRGANMLATLLHELPSSITRVQAEKYSDTVFSKRYINETDQAPVILSHFYKNLGCNGAMEDHSTISVDRSSVFPRLTKIMQGIDFFGDNSNVKEMPFLPHGLADGNNHTQERWYPYLLEDIAKEKDNA